MNNFEDYKHYAEDFLERFYGVPTNRNFKCLNPMHNDDNPSMGYEKNKCRAHCFGCGASYDIFDLIELYFGIKDKGEQFKKAQELYGGASVTPTRKSAKTIQKNDKTEDKTPKKQEIKEYIEKCITNSAKTDFFKQRGITAESVIRFGLGYDTERKAIVIPYNKTYTYYQTRCIEEKKFFKPKSEDAGAEPLYNAEALRMKDKTPVFIVESPLCAISIMQCGGMAISTCGTGGITKVITAVKKKAPRGTLILSMDNDEPGQRASLELADKLKELKIKFITYNIADECKDPNELLQKDTKKLQNNVQKAIIEAKKQTLSEFDSFTAKELQEMELPPIKWLVKDLLPQGLSILAAPSKAGKSWMMFQLCLAITQGQEFLGKETVPGACWYLALEDSKPRMKDRMLKLNGNKSLPSNLHINLKAPTIDNGLMDLMQVKLENNPDIQLIIIDTLQKVRGKVDKNAGVYGNDYREMGVLKEFADKKGIGILLVHHLRKMSDDDTFNRISGSTGIMGSCDTIFTISKKKRLDEEATFSMTGRDIVEEELTLTYDKTTHKWIKVANAEEKERLKEKEQYESNDIVRTIKAIMKANKYGWKGSATDIMKQAHDLLGIVLQEVPSAIGKIIQSYEMQLYYDGITHKYNKGKRIHEFADKMTATYNKSFFD